MSTPILIQRKSKAPSSFSEAEQRVLRAIVAEMIPAEAQFDVPGADDPLIFADLLDAIEADAGSARAVLRALDAACGQPFADLGEGQREVLARRFLERPPREFAVFYPFVVQCYYRDDRVMRSIGMEARAPFPKGYDLESGDWSLLDAVRARPKVWRDAP